MITISTNHQLTQAGYEDLRWSAILAMEGVKDLPYLDTANPRQLTIGVGFNIEGNQDLRNRIFDGGIFDGGIKGTEPIFFNL